MRGFRAQGVWGLVGRFLFQCPSPFDLEDNRVNGFGPEPSTLQPLALNLETLSPEP